MKRRVLIVIDEDLLEEFKKTIGEVYGYRKGALSNAIEEAMKLWIRIKKQCMTDNSVCDLYETDDCPLRGANGV